MVWEFRVACDAGYLGAPEARAEGVGSTRQTPTQVGVLLSHAALHERRRHAQRRPPPPENLLPISIFLIARNEARRIARCIEAARELGTEIVLVDSGSTDGTQRIAAQLGARVIHNAWPGYGAQKRFAEQQCRNDWLLNLDADEVVTPELAREIRALFESGAPLRKAYAARIVDVIPGDDKPRLLAYAHRYVRLYHRSAGRFADSPVHDTVRLHEGVVPARLKGAIHHFSMQDIGAQIAKFNSYTDAQVADLARRGATLQRARLFVELPASFIKAFIGRRHFMRGTYGFITAMNYAIFRYLRVAKHYERDRLARRSADAHRE